jgi:hypothetical protein
MSLTLIDKDAITRAIAVCRAESAARAKLIDSKLRDEKWESAAQFASYSAQNRCLRLQPWQSPRRPPPSRSAARQGKAASVVAKKSRPHT